MSKSIGNFFPEIGGSLKSFGFFDFINSDASLSSSICPSVSYKEGSFNGNSKNDVDLTQCQVFGSKFVWVVALMMKVFTFSNFPWCSWWESINPSICRVYAMPWWCSYSWGVFISKCISSCVLVSIITLFTTSLTLKLKQSGLSLTNLMKDISV